MIQLKAKKCQGLLETAGTWERGKMWILPQNLQKKPVPQIPWFWTPGLQNLQLSGFEASMVTCWAVLVAQTVKDLPEVQETQLWPLGQKDPLEKQMATPSSILAWRIPRAEKPGGLQSMGSQKSQTWLSKGAYTVNCYGRLREPKQSELKAVVGIKGNWFQVTSKAVGAPSASAMVESFYLWKCLANATKKLWGLGLPWWLSG